MSEDNQTPEENTVEPTNVLELELDHYDPQEQEDKEWQQITGMNYEELTGAIEAIIFMSDKPVTLTKLKKLISDAIPLRVFHDCIGCSLQTIPQPETNTQGK